MHILTFDLKQVVKLAAHAANAPEWAPAYSLEDGSPEVVLGPALWLVGDQGVYLMSNGKPPLRAREGEEKNVVAYAEGMNPDVDEDFYEQKREVWGGDDGVAELPWCKAILALNGKANGRTKLQLSINSKGIRLEGLAE